MAYPNHFTPTKRKMSKLKKFIPLLIIVILMAVGYFSGFFKALNYETLRYHHVELTEYVNNNPLLTPLMFIGTYIVATALSIPGGIFLSILGGFLFRQPWCTLYVVIGATTGAALLFLAARTAFGTVLKEKAGPKLQKFEKGFHKNPSSYLLFLRLIPLFPFWLVNLAPAFFNVPLWTYVWTTFVGIAPGAFVSTQAGRGLNTIFETSDTFQFSSIFNAEINIALIGLAIISLLPIMIRKWKEKKNDRK